MKSTSWLKSKFIEISREKEFIEKQIKERNLEFENLWKHKYISKDGTEMNISLMEQLSAVTAKKLLIQEILS